MNLFYLHKNTGNFIASLMFETISRCSGNERPVKISKSNSFLSYQASDFLRPAPL